MNVMDGLDVTKELAFVH